MKRFLIILFVAHAVIHVLFPALDLAGHVISFAAAAWGARHA